MRDLFDSCPSYKSNNLRSRYEVPLHSRHHFKIDTKLQRRIIVMLFTTSSIRSACRYSFLIVSIAFWIFSDLVVALPFSESKFKSGTNWQSRSTWGFITLTRIVHAKHNAFVAREDNSQLMAQGTWMQESPSNNMILTPGPSQSVYPAHRSSTFHAAAKEFAKKFNKVYFLNVWTSDWLTRYFGPNRLDQWDDKIEPVLQVVVERSSGIFYIFGDPGSPIAQISDPIARKDRDLFWQFLYPRLISNKAISSVVIVNPVTLDQHTIPRDSTRQKSEKNPDSDMGEEEEVPPKEDQEQIGTLDEQMQLWCLRSQDHAFIL